MDKTASWIPNVTVVYTRLGQGIYQGHNDRDGVLVIYGVKNMKEEHRPKDRKVVVKWHQIDEVSTRKGK